MTADEVRDIANDIPEIEQLKELKKAGKFWDIYKLVRPFINLLIVAGWFLPRKIKDVLRALILAGDDYLQSQENPQPEVKKSDQKKIKK